jgi:small subunit ribosomal protein S12
MPTVNQLVRHGRSAKRPKSKVPALAGSPQKRGVSSMFGRQPREQPESAVGK